jgi:hypothetical protein
MRRKRALMRRRALRRRKRRRSGFYWLSLSLRESGNRENPAGWMYNTAKPHSAVQCSVI